ncbi:MAG TPA: S9 family peptidase [Thermoanaerobaculia bacterium]|nr:S9 family peptidase [Thermoanaerobaculia bacterium]
MRLVPLPLLLCGLAALMPETASAQTQRPDPKKLTTEAVFATDAAGRRASDLAWSPDGTRLAYLWDDGAGKALWILDPATGRRTTVPGSVRPARTADQAPAAPAIDDFQWSPNGVSLLVEAGGDLFLHPAAGGPVRRLTETKAAETLPRFSPNGNRLAFVRDNDLYMIDLDKGGRESRLTTGGEHNVTLNGIADWVYWEEIWDRETTGFWWSPDSTRIAYYQFDETPVGVYPLTVEADPAVPARADFQKYPRPGEPLPKVRVGVLDLPSGRTTWTATGEEDSYLARVDWTPDGRAVAIQRLNRAQNRIDLLRCDAVSGDCSTLHTQSWPTWVNLGNDLRFLSDGRFVWGSEQSGWRRLYLHDAEGKIVRPLTPEGWAVTSLDAVADNGEWLIFTAFRTEGTPAVNAAERQVMRVSLNEGTAAEPLTREPGWHEANVASASGLWVHTWSDGDTPHRAEVRGRDGQPVADLPSTPPRFDPAALPRWKLGTIAGPEGSRLPFRYLEPEGFNPARRYPVVVYHYGGPGSQVVVNRWDTRGRDLWHKMMAQRGFVVAMVDNRSSLFFGKAGEDRDHRAMGKVNLAAQLALVDHLKAQPWADAGRIGLWGWSGGGFNTLYCLFHRPGVWKAGVAGAPVTDWRLYDAIWTERYLGTPKDNPQGYRASSPFHNAEKLRDRLLVVHGLADDNVHPQNTVALSDRLVRAGLPFEQAFYPGQKHGFRGESQTHFFARMTEFFERTLQQVVVVDVEAEVR